jgi:hypothetical protein
MGFVDDDYDFNGEMHISNGISDLHLLLHDMSNVSIAVSTTSSHSTTMTFDGPVATVKRASGKGPALVIKYLDQTRGMRVQPALMRSRALFQFFCACVLRLFRLAT